MHSKTLSTTSSRNSTSSCPASGTSLHTSTSSARISPDASSLPVSQARPFAGHHPFHGAIHDPYPQRIVRIALHKRCRHPRWCAGLRCSVLVAGGGGGEDPADPARRARDGRDELQKPPKRAGQWRGERGAKAQADGATDDLRDERAAECPTGGGECRREVQERVERVEERDVRVREDSEEGGVHPAGACGEGEGNVTRGAAGAGLVESDDLYAVRVRDALDHGGDEAVPAEAAEEDEDGPEAVGARIGEHIRDCCRALCAIEL
ncbi:hypothetical protein FB451DRAFT_1375843 [Mycena latifolia]|nr:hypothetical protein FB451DRAFT_1375843 [Mycena latifolia]